MITYLLHVSILIAGSFLFYWLLLRKETYYQLNRYLLLFILIGSLAIPLVKIPQSWSLNANNSIENVFNQSDNHQSQKVTLGIKSLVKLQNTKNVTPGNVNKLSYLDIFKYFYISGVIIFFFAFLIQLVVLIFKRNKLEYVQDDKYRIYELNDNTPPFSFYKWIFINPTLYDNTTYEQIIAHEKIHINQAHYIDKLIGELGFVILWFNPFVWALRKAIADNLEYLTDAQMILNGVEAESYQTNLLQVLVPQRQLDITTNYSQSTLHKRIIMMNNTRSSAKSSWKYLIFVPLMIISIPSLNATYDTKNINKQITDHQNNKMKVHRSLITKEIYFANLSLKKLVSIDNVTGKISVQGYNGKSVKVEIEKIITATSDKELKRGIEETKVKTIDLDQEKYLYLGTPYSKFDTTSNTFSYKNNCGNNSCFEYKFELHYKILVPLSTSLRLSTINGGNIVVTGVKGEQLVVKHISGSITLKDISFETTDVFTISGDIKGSYIENPTQQSSYVTTSGNIDIDYVTGLDATVTYEIKDGRLVTDFMAESINTKNTSHVNKPIKSSVKIGSGNVGFFFKTTSGDVSLNKS